MTTPRTRAAGAASAATTRRWFGATRFGSAALGQSAEMDGLLSRATMILLVTTTESALTKCHAN